MAGVQVASSSQLEDAYATTILHEKRARKLAEEDAQRLYNRVRQLTKEEDKAKKRIHETKKKAKEIIKLRERNDLKHQEKEQRVLTLQEEIERQKLENIRLKDEAEKNKIDAENKIYQEKVATVQKTKEEKQEIERLLEETRLLAHKKALEQKETVKKAQIEAEQRSQLHKAAKMQMAAGEYERRLREEMEAKEKKEKEIQHLAQVELDLIERLKQKQLEQRKAYQQLEAVLAMGSAKNSSGKIGTSTQQSSIQAQKLPPTEPTEEDVARAFAVYDSEGTGMIATTSLGGLMTDLGVPLNSTQLSQAIAQLDTKQCGSISFGEFLLWWKG